MFWYTANGSSSPNFSFLLSAVTRFLHFMHRYSFFASTAALVELFPYDHVFLSMERKADHNNILKKKIVGYRVEYVVRV